MQIGASVEETGGILISLNQFIVEGLEAVKIDLTYFCGLLVRYFTVGISFKRWLWNYKIGSDTTAPMLFCH